MRWGELIKERSSIRSYKDKKVDEKLLEQVRQYMKELSHSFRSRRQRFFYWERKQVLVWKEL